MTQLHVYLCYGGGLSPRFLAQKTRAAVKKSKVNATIRARSESEVTQYLSEMDILYIGPHYGSRLKTLENIVAPYNIPAIIIPEEIYSMLDSKALLQLAVDILEKYKV